MKDYQRSSQVDRLRTTFVKNHRRFSWIEAGMIFLETILTSRVRILSTKKPYFNKANVLRLTFSLITCFFLASVSSTNTFK